MFELRNKTILLISPQPWGKMHVSKHHYAIELAKRGNTVYFLNPPNENQTKSIEISNIPEFSTLFSINYKPYFPFSIRFKFRWLYNILIKKQINNIIQVLPKKPDLTWCFDPNLFSDLRSFKTSTNIYHPVDPLIFPYQLKPAKTATAVFSVSEEILSGLRPYNSNCYFINHGISDDFEIFAQKNLKEIQYKDHTTIKVGYVGNLLRGIIDHDLIMTLIKENPGVNFNFWGPASINESNLSGSHDKNVIEFINFLSNQQNVQLHGSKSPVDLIAEIDEMDAFILIYKEKRGESDRSNAHKILEYLCTGKIVIANLISTYANNTDLLCMPEDGNDKLLPELFSKVMNNIQHYNSVDLMKSRISLTLENTYKKQIDRVQVKLNKTTN